MSVRFSEREEPTFIFMCERLAPKRQKKAVPFASNLSKDWKKKATQLKGEGEKNVSQLDCSVPLRFRTKNFENTGEAEDTAILSEESGTKDKAVVRSQINAPRTLLTPKQTKEADCEWAKAIEWRAAVKKVTGQSSGMQARGDGNMAISAEPVAQSTKSVS